MSLRRGKLAREDMLKIPHVYQGAESNDCVPASVLMVVRFYRESMKMGDAIPDPSLEAIKSAMDTKADGTTLNDVPKANRVLKGKTHFIELTPKRGVDFRAIRKEVKAGRPVIVIVKSSRDMRVLAHSMVVKGIDATGLRIVFDDPALVEGEREMEVTEFLRLWGNTSQMAVEVRVDRKPPQKELGDF